jgi:hypothetical protein
MFIEFGIDGNGINERGLVTRKAFGWWQINPMVKLVVGMDDTGFSPMNPSQMIGLEGGRLNVIGVGFGNLYPGRVPQIRLDFKPSKTMRFRIGIADNSWDLGVVGDGSSCAAYGDPVLPAAAGKAVQDETKMPRFDVSAVLSFGPLTIYPGFMYAKKSWDDVAPGSDDEVKTYALSLGAKFAAGPFTFRAEYNTGENWGNQDFLGIGVENAGGLGAAIAYLDGVGNTKIEDSDMDAWWVDVSFKVAPATIHLIYGQQDYENAAFGGLVAGNKISREQTVKMYGISVPIPVAKVFIIRPELMFYDLDEKEVENGPDIDRGKYMILGVQFQIVF